MFKRDVINYCGGIAKAAELLEIKPQAISMWPEIVPRSRQWQIEVLTNGALRAERKSASNDAHNTSSLNA